MNPADPRPKVEKRRNTLKEREDDTEGPGGQEPQIPPLRDPADDLREEGRDLPLKEQE